MNPTTAPTFPKALADMRASVRDLPDDIQVEVSMAVLYISNLYGIAQRRQLSPQDQEHASATFRTWLAGDTQR
jgi:hypothetical protein